MSNDNFSSKRIFKNTIALYIRSIISMLIGLYSSRVLLKVLGVEDFGIYQAVGGMVALFGFLNATMSVSCQRFYNFEIGQGNSKSVSDIFCMSLNIQTILAVLMCLICEVVGIYALYNFLNLPEERLEAAFWVLHLSVIALFVSIISLPYNSMIIAKEDMKSFAYVDILGAVLKLVAILVLELFSCDFLILYALLIVFIQILLRYIYAYICKSKFTETRYHLYWNKIVFKKMISFSGWTTLSAITYVIRIQGISTLYNAFYGVIVSAAIGISNQINNAITTLVNNFTTSFNPQITKNYASGELYNCVRLHFSGPKFSFILVSIISAPIIVNTDFILVCWLKNVPQYTTLFVWLILIELMFRSLIASSNTVIRATGNVKSFEIICNSIQLIFILLAYFCFKYTDNISLPYICIIISTAVMSLYLVYKSCLILKIPMMTYFFQVYIRMLVPYVLYTITIMSLCKANSIIILIIQSFIIILGLFVIDYIICLDKTEKAFVKKIISKFIKNITWRKKV